MLNLLKKDEITALQADMPGLTLGILTQSNVTSQYVEWLNDYEVVKYTEQRFVTHDIQKVRRFVINKFESFDEYLFGIFLDKSHIGNIKIGPVNCHHKQADISYIIGSKKAWGRGIASSVVRRVSEFGFQELRLERITAGCYALNVASARVLEKCGFNQVARIKNSAIFEGGRVDTLLYAKLSEFS